MKNEFFSSDDERPLIEENDKYTISRANSTESLSTSSIHTPKTLNPRSTMSLPYAARTHSSPTRSRTTSCAATFSSSPRSKIISHSGGGSGDDSSKDDEESRRQLNKEEEDECKLLEIRAEFIKGSIRDTRRKSTLIMLSDGVPFFDQTSDNEFCRTEPHSGLSTPRREARIEMNLSAKTIQDLKEMRTRLEYMTQQVQTVNNNYISIQTEITELRTSMNNGGCCSCFF